ncbi:TetR/AcrR family transcriptional regulator [Acetobacterium sp. UBA5834]|jgi:AcrR family transcriptional regulator|nr:TetR family transcriptional regulator [Acetobacterium sp. UBA5834]
MELMETRPISKISVKMICETADINRSTFYAHYADQYALLTQLEEP